MGRGILNFNVYDGSLEAIVHGYKDGFLRPEEYASLVQCDSLGDMKSQLQVTDYGNFLQHDGQAQLSARVIVERAQEHYAKQLRELRSWAAPPLSHFLDFITYEHMIANVLKLIIAKRSGRDGMQLLTRCHPLGWFPELASLTAAADVREMFEVVLIDSPVGRFFNANGGLESDLDELSVEYIQGMLMKNYYEQFYDLCCELGGATAEVMCPLLELEADLTVLRSTVNTMGVPDIHATDRRRLFPSFGSLVDIHDDIAEAESVEQLRERVRRFGLMHELLDDSRYNSTSSSSAKGGNNNRGNNAVSGAASGQTGASAAGASSLERRFVEVTVALYRDALSRQFQYGVFYAWAKLKELEVSNLHWIADCIAQGMMHRVDEYVSIF
ncbi:V-type proton ATPase subunit D, putative [Trypanosoma equiperdum]|uniref:V-type proton ATPase subunit n=2 Tax=Trypanozoon TaxID=39700 RepID=Q57VV8_TRYB2|nr:vacuolar ATP synthase, putative [Trypanosoma brucei brucei TREU927]AAX70256.1 vacuolar ATP synthase, putative [Trypanosoma brucei]AAZ11170.1 vacuolar ATP synthase, putative [Trypanosoma brucei brucei TREU927]SCU64467.1 V-type proton ATPase subunit D, putative [Trypanosoma equiperdum]